MLILYRYGKVLTEIYWLSLSLLGRKIFSRTPPSEGPQQFWYLTLANCEYPLYKILCFINKKRKFFNFSWQFWKNIHWLTFCMSSTLPYIYISTRPPLCLWHANWGLSQDWFWKDSQEIEPGSNRLWTRHYIK